MFETFVIWIIEWETMEMVVHLKKKKYPDELFGMYIFSN